MFVCAFVLLIYCLFMGEEYHERKHPDNHVLFKGIRYDRHQIRATTKRGKTTHKAVNRHGREIKISVLYRGGTLYRKTLRNWLNVAVLFAVTILVFRILDLSTGLIAIGGTAFTWNAASDGNWDAGGNWSGGTGSNYPGQAAGDTALFNATSVKNCSMNYVLANALTSLTLNTGYSGTVTVNAAQTLSFGASTFTAGTFSCNGYDTYFSSVVTTTGTLQGNASNIYCGGNFSSNAGWVYGTSTVIFTANAAVNDSRNYNSTIRSVYYNITVNTGVNVLFGDAIGLGKEITFMNVCTMLGSATLRSAVGATLYVGTFGMGVGNVNTNPYVVSGSQTTTDLVMHNFPMASVSYNMPALSVKAFYFMSYNGTTAPTCMLTGDLTSSSDIIWGNNNALSGIITMNTAGHTVTCVTMQMGYTHAGVMICGASIINVSGNVTIIAPSSGGQTSATPYITFNSSTWNVGGNWSNPTTSASWNPGTSTINLNGTIAQTLAMNNGASVNIYYFNITISNSSAGLNVTLGANKLDINGAFNCSTTTATIKWDTNNGSLDCAGNFTLANGCGWTPGSGNMTFNGNLTIADSNAAAKNLGTVVIATACTVYYYKVLTISGSLSGSLTTDLSGANTATWTNLTIQGTGVLHTCGAIVVTSPAGTEVWGVGQERSVTWVSGTTPFKLELSVDSGGSYPTTIVASTPSSPYTWYIKGVATTKTTCRVKVTASDGAGSSAADFTIQNNNLLVTSTETLKNGATYKTKTVSYVYNSDNTLKRTQEADS